MTQGASNGNIFRNCVGRWRRPRGRGGAGPGAEGILIFKLFSMHQILKLVFWVACFSLYVPFAISTEDAYNKNTHAKVPPPVAQSRFIPVTHKGPFLCYSLAVPGRMCDIMVKSCKYFRCRGPHHGTSFFWVFLLIAN